MGRLNADRTIPFDFRVFELDEVVWLFDDSAREYPCTATPHVYAEPLYSLDGECDDLPDGSLFLASDVAKWGQETVPLDPEYTAPDVEEKDAWDSAREEAQANHLL